VGKRNLRLENVEKRNQIRCQQRWSVKGYGIDSNEKESGEKGKKSLSQSTEERY
jgi:hypothetical protein